MEWLSTTAVSKILHVNFDKAREVVQTINDDRSKKGLYVPNKNKVPKQALEKYLGFKIEE
ncbi:MAG: hypothetical protein RR945_00370 [Erysipelotrichaceae bacterium]